jgi:hypothetical protein
MRQLPICISTSTDLEAASVTVSPADLEGVFVIL